MVKAYIANQRAIFGVRTSHSYAHRQVSFSDRDSTPERYPKKVQEKPSSSLEDELLCPWYGEGERDLVCLDWSCPL
jgi:hypothetical protein